MSVEVSTRVQPHFSVSLPTGSLIEPVGGGSRGCPGRG